MDKIESEEKEPARRMPAFVKSLTDPDTPYNCWFIVGDQKEEIGGNNLSLMAHSEVFRKMLHESPLAEKGPVKIEDIEPATFKHFLKFVNGYHEVAHLSLEEMVDLLCVGERYLVEELKKVLGKALSARLNVNNVYVAMSKVECFQDDSVKSASQKIIQQQTKTLLASDEFLGLTVNGILSIVTQDCLQISEIELWRAVLDWAKHQIEPDKGVALRKVLSEPLKHIRFCTMDGNDFNKEVATTGILTDGEIVSIVKIMGGASVIKTLGEKADASELTSISYKMDARSVFSEEEFEINFSSLSVCSARSSTYFYLTTEQKAVQLLSAKVGGIPSSTVNIYWCAPKRLSVGCECIVHLTKITNYGNNTSTEQPIEFRFSQDVPLDSTFVINFPKEMNLLPLNKYKLLLSFNYDALTLYSGNTGQTLSNTGLLVISDSGQYLYSQVQSVKYKVM